MKRLTVHTAEKAQQYPILIAPDLIKNASLWHLYCSAPHIAIITNETVAPLYLSSLKAALTDKKVIDIILLDGECHKNLATYQHILTTLLEAHLGRDGLLIALGGGVINDITGFVAATYQRGICWITFPTTLLAQVDAAVGGKTGVNHACGKNMIGAFYPPQAVLMDTATLSTLPPREFSAGLAEVIKYALIYDISFLSWLEQHMDAVLRKEKISLENMIMNCCRYKSEIVCADEREQGMRALLNFGHTFGHALETITAYRHWLHGEAVAIGMRMAAELSEMRGLISADEKARVIALLQRAHLPTVIDIQLNFNDIYQTLFLDKKVRAGQLRFVLLSGLGQAHVVDDVTETEIFAVIAASRSENESFARF